MQILNLLAGSALSSDVSSELFQQRLYAEQAVLDRHPESPDYAGRDAIAAIMRDPDHVAHVESGMVHLATQPYVHVDVDTAVACGYLQVVRGNPDILLPEVNGPYPATPPSLWMVTANVWQFEREDGMWFLVRRIIRDALSAEGRELIRAVIEEGRCLAAVETL